MAKHTKKYICQAVLNILSDGGTLNIEEITRKTGITRQTIKNNFDSKGIEGIMEYIYREIIIDINIRLFQHDPDEMPLEIFADIVLNAIWKHRDTWYILYKSNYHLQAVTIATAYAYPKVKDRYQKLMKKHALHNIMSPKDLFMLRNSYLFAVLSTWLNVSFPVEPHIFKPKFIYLMTNSMEKIFYSNIGYQTDSSPIIKT